MDNITTLQFNEIVEKEMAMQRKWLKDMDLSNVRPMPAEQFYRVSSITKIPYYPESVEVSASCKKPVTRDNFERAKSSFGFVYAPIEEITCKDDLRPIKQVYRNTGLPSKNVFPVPSEAFRGTEFHGTSQRLQQDFYRKEGAFRAVLED